MLLRILLLSLCVYHNVNGQFGDSKQSFGYVDVREGAHMFYWLFYTTAVEDYTERPLIVWLQGGPGGSSTGYGNFELIGPLDMDLQPRNYTWVNDFNVLFIDNPVGTGFSYVDDLSYLTTDNEQIADDFVQLMRGFYSKHPELLSTPLYIYGQSYGGKMAVDMGLKMKEAQANGILDSNLRGIAMGNAWISPLDSTLTWAPLLFAAGLVDQEGHDLIQTQAQIAEELFNNGQYAESTEQWAMTQSFVFFAAGSVDFYNILTKMPMTLRKHEANDVIDFQRTFQNKKSAWELTRDMLINNRAYRSETSRNDYNLMNNLVKPALNIPEKVIWGSQASAVFDYLRVDFMKPVTSGIERLLNETDILVVKYNGNLDLICDTPGQLLWVDRLKWEGADAYKTAPRVPIWEDDRLEGYSKSNGNFRFFFINEAGHSVPRDNPAGTRAFLRNMTSFG